MSHSGDLGTSAREDAFRRLHAVHFDASRATRCAAGRVPEGYREGLGC